MVEQMTSHFCIVEARYYEEIADLLATGALAEIQRFGGTYQRLSVPGVFELPAAIRYSSDSVGNADVVRKIDAYIILGCVIRGETSHYDIVSQESARGITDLVIAYSLALGYGVLTCENLDQAIERASPSGRDKGGEAARAAIQMLHLKRDLHLISQ